MRPHRFVTFGLLAVGAFVLGAAVQEQREGYDDTPVLPGQKWKVHDRTRPYPAKVTPGTLVSTAPSDAIVLFDGKDLSQFCRFPKGDSTQPMEPTKWVVEDGAFHVTQGAGNLFTKEKFGDCQLHFEWRADKDIRGRGQGRGNSGVFFMGLYEVQVLESFGSATYADGQAGSLYGQWPPLVNPIRPPGEWNAYDIVFKAPQFDGDKVVEPAYLTVFVNGVLVHDHMKLNGPTNHAVVLPYEKHGPEEHLEFQDHGPNQPPKYRNVWIRRLKGYDQPEK